MMGRSGRAMLDALVSGTTDPGVLADLARGLLRKKLPALQEALEGRFDAEHTLVVGRILAHIDYLDEAMTSRRRSRRSSGRSRRRSSCCAQSRVSRAAEVIIAETGGDMTAFASAKHLASWAGMCPGNDESAGKRRSGKTRKCSKWLSQTLVECAKSANRSNDTYLAAQYRRLKARRGANKATIAICHSILTATSHMLQTGETYTDPGGDFFARRDPERTRKRLVGQLERLGYTVTVQEGGAAASA